MGRMIVKPRRDADLYVEWSSVVDAPTRWGPRDEMREYLLEGERHFGGRFIPDPEEVDKRLDLADRNGTSINVLYGGSDTLEGSWDDAGFVVMNVAEGWLPRERLYEFMERLTAEQPVDDLLEPFEDDARVEDQQP